jgi:DNA repair exonuclease SbcCD ATPase subunit
MIQRGAHSCRVTARIDGKCLTKIRTKGKAEYRFRKSEYKAFGNTVPDPIVEFVAVDEDNIQKQHDAPFWLALTSGELSKLLNKVVDLASIDSTIGNLGKWLRTATAEVQAAQDRLKKLRIAKKELAFVAAMDAAWLEVESLTVAVDDITETEGRVQRLAAAAHESHRLLCAIQTSSDEMAASLLEARPSFDEVTWIRRAIRKLEPLIDEISDMESRLAGVEERIGQAQSELGEYKTCPVCGGKL